MLALDEPRENDETSEVDGFSFVVDKELLAQAQPIHIDMNYAGFTLSSSLQLGGGGCGSSCGSDSSCGSGSSCAC